MKTKRKKAAIMFHVAVVLNTVGPEKALALSGRPEGDWGSFVALSQDDAVGRAVKARAKWEAKGYGPYQIFVGTLTAEVIVPTNFKLVKL